MSVRPLLALTAAAFVLAGCGQSAVPQPAKTVETVPADVDGARIGGADKEPGNWMSTGRTYSEQRFSPLADIDTGNVDKLGLAWSYKLDVDRVAEATPIVVDGVMYVTGAYSIVSALDAATGREIWKFDPKVPRDKDRDGCCDAANRGVAVWKGKVYVGAYDGRLIAIDARTGTPVWSADTVLDHERSYTISGAPRIVKGRVIIGNGGAEFGVRGYITAYDAETGKQDWRFFTVPGDPGKPPENKAMEIALPTWKGDQWWTVGGGGGSTAWDSMAYDPDLDLLYVGTGNGSIWNRSIRSPGGGDNLFLSSIVAIRPETGEYVWHYQTTPGDRWDYTATQHIILADLDIGGKTRKVLMQAPKNGFFYVLDRQTGELLSANKYAPANWASHVDMKTGRPVELPASDWTREPKLISPGPLGGHNWMPMSFDPQTGLVYIPMQEVAALYAPDPDQKFDRKGVWHMGTQPIAFPEDPKALEGIMDMQRGHLIAWNPVTGKEVWRQSYVTTWNGGTLSTAGGLVFQGTADGRFVAYSATGGQKLWESPANTGVLAGPVSYKVDGEQYVAVSAGWGGAFPVILGGLSARAGVLPDSRILVYKIGGSATLPPAKKFDRRLPDPLPEMTASDGTIDKGRSLYNGHCGMCHGPSAIGGNVLPDLRYLSTEKHGMFAGILAGAFADRGMPAMMDVLSKEDVVAIHQYIIKRAHDLKRQQALETASGR